MCVDWRVILLLSWAGAAMVCGAFATGGPLMSKLRMKLLLTSFAAYILISFILIACVLQGAFTDHI